MCLRTTSLLINVTIDSPPPNPSLPIPGNSMLGSVGLYFAGEVKFGLKYHVD